jgi:hypothetical protein
VCRHESIFEKKAIDQTIDYRLKSAQFWKAYLVGITRSTKRICVQEQI